VARSALAAGGLGAAPPRRTPVSSLVMASATQASPGSTASISTGSPPRRADFGIGHRHASPTAWDDSFRRFGAARRVIAMATFQSPAAVNDEGSPTFPILHRRDEDGEPLRVPPGELPSMHSFRHTVASRAPLAGESVDEIAFLLGHRDANLTRAVYVRELADTRRRSMRRSRMIAEFGQLFQQ